MSAHVLFETRGKIALITINRPERYNALGLSVRAGLWDALERFETDPALHVAILTGAGDKAFCAGMDLKEAAETGLAIPSRGRDGVPYIGENIHVGKPTIAAVNGVAFAGGWMISQMCDLCVAADSARFAITEARVGRGTPWAVPLIHMLPKRIMTELVVTGGEISPQRLYELGYLNRVVPLDRLMETAFALAEQIVANAPLSVRASLEMTRLAADLPFAEASRMTYRNFEPVYLSNDAREGPRAFAEKRKPVWTGT